jgi:PAS domain-containing protein
MQLFDQKKRSNREELPPSIYAALVDSLFQNFVPTLAGTFCTTIVAVMTALKTGNHMVWPCAIWISIVGVARAMQMRSYELERRVSPLTPERAPWWENSYKNLADLYASSLGLWCFVVVLGSDDAVAHMLCASVTIGYTAASAGRNYARPWIIQRHIVFSCAPLALALILHGDAYYSGLGLLLALFFVGLKYINLSLNAIFVDALTSSMREAALATRFDTALNNMPHGLCMFTSDGYLAVMNHRFSEMMKLPPDLAHLRPSASGILSACVDAGSLSEASGKMILAEIENPQAKGSSPPIPTWREAARCLGRSSRWPMGAPSSSWKTSPNGATPRPGSRIWRVMTN